MGTKSATEASNDANPSSLSHVRRQRIEPRGLRLPDAAAYVGVSESKYSQMEDAGLMPCPMPGYGGCTVYDRYELDAAMDALKDGGDDFDFRA